MRDTHTTFTVEPKLVTVEKSIITMHVHKVGAVPRDPTLPVFRATEELPREVTAQTNGLPLFFSEGEKESVQKPNHYFQQPLRQRGSAPNRSIVNSYTLPGEREAPLFWTVAREYKGSRVRAFFLLQIMEAAAPPKRMD